MVRWEDPSGASGGAGGSLEGEFLVFHGTRMEEREGEGGRGVRWDSECYASDLKPQWK